jgi:predicted AAA+ superfamily ATPase
MIKRTLAKTLLQSAKHYPVLTVTGPRQSGKTTLVKSEFKDYLYVSLELPDQRSYALEDPRGFLDQFNGPVILDEAQRAPDLFSYIQVLVDEKDQTGQFVLTGSHNFLLLQTISQSLAGRCAIHHLLPFSLAELSNRAPFSIDKLGIKISQVTKPRGQNLMELLLSGFYPRIHDRRLSPTDWLANYYQTYLERDVRNVLNVGDLETFGRFVGLCAGRNGQLLNLSSLASDCGITHTTAKRWISILEASFLVILLRPHHQSFGKRLIKSPKLYFLDTGLLCFLLQIKTSQQLQQHASRGAVFESFVVSELYKNYLHRSEIPHLFYWRDSHGHEIDLLVDKGNVLFPIEIKSAQTVASDFFDNIKFWQSLSKQSNRAAALVYGGDNQFKRNHIAVYPWFVL